MEAEYRGTGVARERHISTLLITFQIEHDAAEEP
jgi:hypothetical protein